MTVHIKMGLFLVAATAAVAVAGCTASSSAGPAPSVSTTAAESLAATTTVSASASATPTPTPMAPATTAAATVTLPANSAALISFVQAGTPFTIPDGIFTTPSGNIGCGLHTQGVYCVIDQKPGWPSIPVQPCYADTVWFDTTINLEPGGTRRGICQPDWAAPAPFWGAPALPYGHTINIYGFPCRSEVAFLACADPGTGNGFAIAREFLRVYGTVLPPKGNL